MDRVFTGARMIKHRTARDDRNLVSYFVKSPYVGRLFQGFNTVLAHGVQHGFHDGSRSRPPFRAIWGALWPATITQCC